MDVELNQLNRRKQASEALDGAGVVMDASQSQCPVEDANPAYRRITGYRVQEALGKPLNLFEGPDTDAAGVAELRAAIGKVTPAARSSATRSEEHTSELQSLMRISYAVFCLKKKHLT